MFFALVVVGVIVVITAYVLIKKRVNLKKAAGGEDLRQLEEAASQVLPGESGYRVVYGHWQRSEHCGRRTTTYYYSYALAFDASRLWVIPFKYEAGIIDPGRPLLLTSDMVGAVEFQNNESKGRLWRVSLTLRDKEGKDFLNCCVDAENTREDRFHHLNIIQEEGCAQFSRFISSFAGETARLNPDMEARMANKLAADAAAQGKRTRTMGIIGLVLFMIPIFSIIFGGIGLFCAPKPRETGGKATSGFILPLVSLIVGILVCAGYVAVAMSF